jgi:hypothetical protein
MTEKMRITYDGKVGIATTSPSTALDVSGSIKANALATGGLAVTGASTMATVSISSNLSVAGSTDMSGGLTVTGDVTATTFHGAFVGDGSGLTNLSISGDSITSGTTKVTANTNGYISLTTGGTTTGYFDTAGRLVVPSISTTGVISGTGGYLGYLNLGTSVSANEGANYSLAASSWIGGGRFKVWSVAGGTSALPAYSWNGSNVGMYFPASDTLALSTSSTEALRIINNGNIGIGTATPNAKLEVAGTISATSIQSTGTMRMGKYSSQPVACAAGYDGYIALTSQYTTCVCNGGTSTWVKTSDGSTACTW